MKSSMVLRAGGLALVLGAIAFMAVFSYLAARFEYPEVLDGPAAEVLPALLGMGTSGRVAWAIYSVLPLIWLPAGVGAYEALGPVRRGTMRLALLFATLSSITMMLGLMRWPTIHWHLAKAYASADPSGQAIIASLFDGLNTYLGNYLGEFIGELSFSMFFLLSALAWLRAPIRQRWVGWLGIATAIASLVGMFRNVTAAVAPVAAVNNYLLPLFMIVFGIGLMRWPEPPPSTES